MRFYRQSFYQNYVNASGWEDKELTLDMILYELADLSNENKQDFVGILKANNVSISDNPSLTAIFDRLAKNLEKNEGLRKSVTEYIVSKHSKSVQDKDGLRRDIDYYIQQFYVDAKEQGLKGSDEMKKKLYLLADQTIKNNVKIGNLIFISSLLFIVGIVIWDWYKSKGVAIADDSVIDEIVPETITAESGTMVESSHTPMHTHTHTHTQPNVSVSSDVSSQIEM